MVRGLEGPVQEIKQKLQIDLSRVSLKRFNVFFGSLGVDSMGSHNSVPQNWQTNEKSDYTVLAVWNYLHKKTTSHEPTMKVTISNSDNDRKTHGN